VSNTGFHLNILEPKFGLGPIFNKSGTNSCWDCLKQSLKTNRRVEVDLFGHDASKLSLPSKAYLNGNEDMAFRICAIQLARWFVNPQNCPLSNHLLTFDPFNFQSESHQCGLICCKKCGIQLIKTQNSLHELKKSPIIFNDENGPRSANLESTYDRLKTIVSPITGIVPTYSLFQVNGDCVVSSVRNLPFYDLGLSQTKKSLRVPDVAVGKGKTELQAKIGCFAESAERYNSTYCHQPYILSKYHDLPQKGFRPDELLLFSNLQYENRDLINKSFGSFNQVSKKYNHSKIRWTLVHSLSGEDSVFVPTSYCYLNYPYEDEIELCPGDTNGCASGNTIEEAIVYGILELIERDAVAVWWYNQIQHPGIRIESLKDLSIINLIDVHRREGSIFHLIDITSDFNIPTFVAVSADKHGNQIHFGTSCHFNPAIAMTRAVRELNQIMTHRALGQTFSSTNVHPCQKEFAKWITKENFKDHPYLNPQSKIDFVLEKYTPINSVDFLDCIYEFTKLLNNKKLSAYWLNLTQINIPFFTVKIIIPGLRHFWNRLGPGRLYDVPVELGLFSSPMAEDQMNKIPYFL
jgi:bacteriocin biosynthesis cyclodehydratase domain-containing protein